MNKAEAWSIRTTGIKAATEIIAKRMWGQVKVVGSRERRNTMRSLRGYGFLSI
jgi:hypothetical protein